MLSPGNQETLRRLALGDQREVARVMAGGYGDNPPLDGRTRALMRLAALSAIATDTELLHSVVEDCHEAGVERNELLGVIGAITPVVGRAQGQVAMESVLAALGVREWH